MEIVDAQVHIWPPESPERPWIETAHLFTHGAEFSTDALLAQMDEAGVDAAVLVPPAFEGDRNDYCLDAARAHLEEALAGAADLCDPEIVLGIHSSLAFALGRMGDLDGAEKLLHAAESIAAPTERARLMAQRGVVSYLRGDLARGAEVEALGDVGGLSLGDPEGSGVVDDDTADAERLDGVGDLERGAVHA